MTEAKRPYRMRERAKSQEETRQKIVEATMHLHEEIGPRATTIKAIAERAGVQRLTVYRHFPDETAVFQACTSHWLELNPLPDPATWLDIEAPVERFRAAIAAFYGYYAGTTRMWTTAFRDVEEVPALQDPMQQVSVFMEMVAEGLISAFGPDPDIRITATVRHALHFTTWAHLDQLGLSEAQKCDLATQWLCCDPD
ncbi:MAG: TetR/AcrR family transcriptional regulator [Pseudooceanicola sp.]